jgi:MFS transporter, MHS family, shikimate and dehydroshikimate transport protein
VYKRHSNYESEGRTFESFRARHFQLVSLNFLALVALVFFQMLNTGHTGMIWLAIALGLALGHGSVYGAQGAYFFELFPPRIRDSGFSLVQQLGPILGGGLSPLIATALLAAYGSSSWVAGYMVAMGLLSAACTFGLRPLRADA